MLPSIILYICLQQEILCSQAEAKLDLLFVLDGFRQGPDIGGVAFLVDIFYNVCTQSKGNMYYFCQL